MSAGNGSVQEASNEISIQAHAGRLAALESRADKHDDSIAECLQVVKEIQTGQQVDRERTAKFRAKLLSLVPSKTVVRIALLMGTAILTKQCGLDESAKKQIDVILDTAL